MLRSCRCGAGFDGEPWHKPSWSCWRRKRDRSELDAAFDRGYQRRLQDGFAAACRVGLSDDLIAGAIQLAHTDRHPIERAADANRIAARLLELGGSA
jgi:hypothetical protein